MIRLNYHSKIVFFLLVTVYLLINLAVMNDYGVTWDFTYHLNAGLYHLHLPIINNPGFIMFASNPLPDILPTLSYLLFFDKLKVLPFDNAYNLISIFMGSLGVGILYLFVKELINTPTAFASAITLALLPRYFGHLHNNMKDIMQSVLFTLCLWLFYRYNKANKTTYLLISCIVFALLLLTKVNALFIPIIVIIWSFFPPINNISNKIKKIAAFLFLGCLLALSVWINIWDKPFFWLKENIQTYFSSTINMPVLYFRNLYSSGVNIPWHYPLGMLFATTPILVTAVFLIGFIILINKILQKDKSSFLIFLWFVIPLSRFLKPHMLVIDDIRHFMEVVFPFVTISAIGMISVIKSISKIVNKTWRKTSTLLLTGGYFVYMLIQLTTFHPFQTSYFNEIESPLMQKTSQFDAEFWGNSYKKAMLWLNQNAPLHSKITVPMIPDIARLYLRPDLIESLNTNNLADIDWKIYTQSNYTVIMNRESFFNWYNIYPYISNRSPIYTLSIKNIPLVFIYKN